MKRFLITLSILFSLSASATEFGLLGVDPWPFSINPIPWEKIDGVWIDINSPQTTVTCIQTSQTSKVKLIAGQAVIREYERRAGAPVFAGLGNERKNQIHGMANSASGKRPFSLVSPRLAPSKVGSPKIAIPDQLVLRVYVQIQKDFIYTDTYLKKVGDSRNALFTRYCQE